MNPRRAASYAELFLGKSEEWSELFPPECAKPEPCPGIEGSIQEIVTDLVNRTETPEGAYERAKRTGDFAKAHCKIGQQACRGTIYCRSGLPLRES